MIWLSSDCYLILPRKKLRSYWLRSHGSCEAEPGLSPAFLASSPTFMPTDLLPVCKVPLMPFVFLPISGRVAAGPLIWRVALTGSGSHSELVAGMVGIPVAPEILGHGEVVMSYISCSHPNPRSQELPWGGFVPCSGQPPATPLRQPRLKGPCV